MIDYQNILGNVNVLQADIDAAQASGNPEDERRNLELAIADATALLRELHVAASITPIRDEPWADDGDQQ